MNHNKSDTAWKIILDKHLKAFFDYCLPELSAMICWDRPPIPLDKELETITKGNNTGKRLLDKLFKVYLKNGQEQWILIHIEVQGKPDEQFPERMFIYAYRTYDKYQKPIISCAILTDDHKSWRPDRFEIGMGGCSLGLKFLMVKLLDYKGKEAELDASSNIFATVILVQLKALELKSKSDVQKKEIKFALTKRLYEKGFTKAEVIDLYEFINWLIGLPEELEIEYHDSLFAIEGEKNMTYVSPLKVRSFNEGKAEGKAEYKLEVAKRLLQAGISLSVIQETTECSLAELDALKSKDDANEPHLVA